MRQTFTMATLLVALSCMSASPTSADDLSYAPGAGWQLERDVDSPTYAFLEPASSDLDIDVIVLSCEQAGRKVGLQLRLYPLAPGPLRSSRSASVDLAPDILIEIDGRRHAAQLLFADDFVVVADATEGPMPFLSAALVGSLQTGRHLTMRLHPANVSPSATAGLVFRITADLQAGIGGTAVTVLRRCGTPNNTLAAGASGAR